MIYTLVAEGCDDSPNDYNNLCEIYWIEYLFGISPSRDITAFNSIKEDVDDIVVFIMTGDTDFQFFNKVIPLAEKLKKFAVIHLSDEHLVRTGRDWLSGLPNCVFYARNYLYIPRNDKIAFFPLGWKGNFANAVLENGPQEKIYTWSFAGDINKSNRPDTLAKLSNIHPHHIHELFSFSAPDSLDINSYAKLIQQSIFIPCPTGNSSVDTFRLAETLEGSAIPILNKSSPLNSCDYWTELFGEGHPLIVLEDWAEAPAIIEKYVQSPEELSELQLKTREWWIGVKDKWKMYGRNSIEKLTFSSE